MGSGSSKKNIPDKFDDKSQLHQQQTMGNIAGAPPAYNQPAYSQPAYSQPTFGQPGVDGQYSNMGELPPAYSAAPNNSIVGATGQPQVQQYTQQYMAQNYPGYQGFAQGPVQATYDAGARFSANSPASIPPPPPGVAPNAAQLAAMQGQQVVMNQKKGGFLEGSGSGGYTFW